MKKTKTILFLVCGSLCVLLAILGMFLPVLPTPPFLLLASFCFARSSTRVNKWLLSNRWFGEYIRNYREGRGISLIHKVITISLLWLTIGYAVWVVSFWWLKLILFSVAVGVTYHLTRINTFKLSTPKPIQLGESNSHEETD